MRVGDLVYNNSIEMYGIIVAMHETCPFSYTWFELLLADGGRESANHLELELISESR
jgi:hypothetical protein